MTHYLQNHRETAKLHSQQKRADFTKDTAVLLTIGSFLLTIQLLCLDAITIACWELFCLQLEPSSFYLQLKLSCLQWEYVYLNTYHPSCNHYVLNS